MSGMSEDEKFYKQQQKKKRKERKSRGEQKHEKC